MSKEKGQPLVEFELDYHVVIKPGVNVHTPPESKGNVIRSVRVGTGEKQKLNVKHRLRLAGATLILVDQMFSKGRIDSRFSSDYVYLRRVRQGSESVQFYCSAAPVKAVGGERHIAPAVFFIDSEIRPFGQYRCVEGLEAALVNEKLNSLEDAGFVRYEIEMIRFDRHGEGKSGSPETLDLSFRMTVSFYRYYWGEVVRVLPTPPLPEPGAAPKHGVLLGIGDLWWTESATCDDDRDESKPFRPAKLWKALESLNPIMHSRKQRVLIRGTPGSGKEVFSEAIHFGSVHEKDAKEGRNARSVAAITSDGLRELLFGSDVEGVVLPGLVSKSEGGTLFLDEFDKIADTAAYAELLRVLEAEEYVPVRGREVKTFREVNWIFAGAFTGTKPSNPETALPTDFWSRLSAQIDITNPLKFEAAKGTNGSSAVRSYAGAAFVYFFLRAAVDYAGGVGRFTAPACTFQARYAQALCFGQGDPTSNRLGSSLETIVTEFQNKIYDGVYCRIYKKFKKPPQTLEPAVQAPNNTEVRQDVGWSDPREMFPDYMRKPPDGLTDCDEFAYVAEFEYDSVRSIRQAANAAFDYMRFKAMSTANFWCACGVPERAQLGDVCAEGVRKAVEVVKQARPGVEPPRSKGNH